MPVTVSSPLPILVALAVSFMVLVRTGPAAALEFETPQALPDVPLLTMEGDEARLEAHAGELVVVNFWATWCAPCKREMPSLARLQAEFDPKALKVVTIAVDRSAPEKIRTFMDEAQAADLPVYRDPKMATMKGFALKGLPTTLVVDDEGRIIARHDGYAEWDDPDIVKALRSHLPSGS